MLKLNYGGFNFEVKSEQLNNFVEKKDLCFDDF